jgi:site-specific DNA-methyltransferase (adenine-specific)
MQLNLRQSIGNKAEISNLFPEGLNRIIHGDCLDVMKIIPEESFDFIYIDPPYFTEKEFFLHTGQRYENHSFTDNWAGGLKEYLDWLEERLKSIHLLLKPEGVFFLHLDWHAVHYVKVILDKIFGYDNFQNEYIWYYSGGGASKTRFARKHDNILFYSKSSTNWKFYADRVREEYKWTRGQKRADGSDRDLEKGKLPDDVWEYHSLLPWAKENVGYPTQKPLALLQKFILATTDEGDVIGDFFGGGGTTAMAAQILNRRWITSDISNISVSLIADRIAEYATGINDGDKSTSREKSKSRFEKILNDNNRLGTTEDLIKMVNQMMFPLIPGFTVEELINE